MTLQVFHDLYEQCNTSFIFNIAHDWFLSMLYDPLTERFPNIILQTYPTKNTAKAQSYWPQYIHLHIEM